VNPASVRRSFDPHPEGLSQPAWPHLSPVTWDYLRGFANRQILLRRLTARFCDPTFQSRFLAVPFPPDRSAVCLPFGPPSRAAFPGLPASPPLRVFFSGSPCRASFRATYFPAFLAVRFPGPPFRAALPGRPLRVALAGLPVERASSRPGLSPLAQYYIASRRCVRTPLLSSPFGAPGSGRTSALPLPCGVSVASVLGFQPNSSL
jgi:hypothetical protein